ncbi:MAG TPA: neutral/alkaline non-lysosomal ceramidase N-terminal domain-containing protein [Longimicrobiales bacterium]
MLRLLPAVLLLTGCISTLPAPVSPEPAAQSRSLRAGFARVDITPPPGVGLFGYGPEGKRAEGFRQRLWARALVLEDVDGERIAFVSADLGAVSALLHRWTAEHTIGAGIGADRLVIAATHTHAGPNHHFGRVFDLGGSAVTGFDRAWTGELSERIGAAVREAAAGLRPARAAWTVFPVWGVTFNRDPAPYADNEPRWRPVFDTVAMPASTAAQPYSSIDPTWALLRIDTRGDDGRYRATGALSVFGMHGTGNPSANTLLDADLHGMTTQRIERALSGPVPGPHPRVLHLFTNGSAGDATAMPTDTRCPVPVLRNRIGPDAVLTILLGHAWAEPDAGVTAACMARSRRRMRAVADTLAARAIAAFRSATPRDSTLRIRRAFRTVEPGREPDFCTQPRVGVATAGGAPDGWTRFGMSFVRDVEEGAGARDTTRRDPLGRCHAPKRYLGGNWLQAPLADWHLLPRAAQLAVVRIGDITIATMPAEVTTTAGGRIRDAVAARLGEPRGSVLLMTLVNGYLQYLTTPEEYAHQHYAGGATIFGRTSARGFQRLLADLAGTLAAGAPAPAPDPGDMRVWLNARVKRAPSPDQGPPTVRRLILPVDCIEGVVHFTWRDLYPGRLLREPYPLLRIERQQRNGTWLPVAWDDDEHVEIRAERPLGRTGYRWNARWSAGAGDAPIRLVLTERPGHPAMESRPVQNCEHVTNR